MGIIKEINIKNRTYYIFDDIINIKDFDTKNRENIIFIILVASL